MIDSTEEIGVQADCQECGKRFAATLLDNGTAKEVLCPECGARDCCERCNGVIHEGKVDFRLPTWSEGHTVMRHSYCVPKVVFLNVYTVSRHFGGSEEGGWYYDAGQIIAAQPILFTEDPAPHIARLTEMFADKATAPSKKMGRFSVLGGKDLEIRIEESMGYDWPEETPQYE